MASPFKLFEPYGSNDKDKFFGRDDETFALYNLLQQTRLVLVYGASGTGKTSVINAGLPKVFKLTDWYRVSVRRKDNINKSFRDELARLTEQTSVPDINAGIQQLYEKRWIPIYLVFDQFEELFTLGNDAERKQFFTDVQTLLDKNLPCKIILSMREEYIGHLYEYEPLLPTLFDKRFRVEPMQDATVKEVIVQMCAGEVELENGMQTAGQILDKIKEGEDGKINKQPVHLPYLQVYLHYLFENATKAKGKTIFTKTGIDAVGKLGNVLKDYIEKQLEAAKQYFTTTQGLPEIFAGRLLDEFATVEGTKQSRKADELALTLHTELTKIKLALEYFTECKLLRADENDVERYEPVHDVVAKQIHELRSVEDKEFRAFARQLEIAHDNWEKDNQNDLRLLNKLDLEKVNVFEKQFNELPDYENKLSVWIKKSRKHIATVEKKEKRRQQILKMITAAAVVGFLIAVGIGYLAGKEKKIADNQKKIAERNFSDLKIAENKREKTEFMQLLNQINNDILPAGFCPNDSMRRMIDTVAKHQMSDADLQQKIKNLKENLKNKCQ